MLVIVELINVWKDIKNFLQKNGLRRYMSEEYNKLNILFNGYSFIVSLFLIKFLSCNKMLFNLKNHNLQNNW